MAHAKTALLGAMVLLVGCDDGIGTPLVVDAAVDMAPDLGPDVGSDADAPCRTEEEGCGIGYIIRPCERRASDSCGTPCAECAVNASSERLEGCWLSGDARWPGRHLCTLSCDDLRYCHGT